MNYAEVSFFRNQWGQLVLTLPGGTEHQDVEPIRCFPLSDPAGSIAVLDAEGREVMELPGMDVLGPAAREVLQRELNEREFMPEIERIISTSMPNPPCLWEVDTDRGRTGFELESEDDIRRIGSNGAIIADANGIRYKVSNIDDLDAHSRRIIRRLV